MGYDRAKGLAYKSVALEEEVRRLNKLLNELKIDLIRLKRVEREHNELLTWYKEVYLVENQFELEDSV